MEAWRFMFLGYIIGALATMLCVRLNGGRLCGDNKKEAPDDDAASEPEQAKMDKISISQKMQVGKKERSTKWKR